MCSIGWQLCWSSPSWQRFVQSWHTCQGCTAWKPRSLGWFLHHWSLTETPAWFRRIDYNESFWFLMKFSLKCWVWFYLCFIYQKIVAQPKPVATLRCESGLGKADRKSVPQRPSCHVISWLTSFGTNLVMSSLLCHSQPNRDMDNSVITDVTPFMIHKWE